MVVISGVVLGVVSAIVLAVVLIVGIIVFFARVVAVTAARTLAVLPEDPVRRHRGHRPKLVWDAYLSALGDMLSSPHEYTIWDLLVISPVCIMSSVVTGVVEQAKPGEHVERLEIRVKYVKALFLLYHSSLVGCAWQFSVFIKPFSLNPFGGAAPFLVPGNGVDDEFP